jgi:hypothetical protein
MKEFISIFLLYIITINSLFVTSSSLSSYLIPEIEIQALHDLYQNTNGISWIWQNTTLSGLKWNFTSNSSICSWQGLACTCDNSTEYHQYRDEEDVYSPYGATFYTYYSDDYSSFNVNSNQSCNINKIYLINYNMSGSIVSSINNLKYLTHLHLDDNHLTGPIPILSFDYVLVISISINEFKGKLFTEIGNLQSLTSLSLTYNMLTGGIPSELGLLSNLTTLWLGNNKFGSTIPTELGQLSSLEGIGIYYNNLIGAIPSEIGNLINLSILGFQVNNLMSSLPDNLQNLHKLSFFSIFSNELTGSISTWIYNFENMLYLEFGFNKFTGIIDNNIGNLKDLKILDICSNKLNGSIPVSISTLPSLEILFLSNNFLEGNLDGVVNSSSQLKLTNIDVSSNYLTSTIPNEIFLIESMQTFASVDNCMNGTLPENICNSINLTALSLDGLFTAKKCRLRIWPDSSFYPDTYFIYSAVITKLPVCLYKLPNLVTLHLSGNGIFGEFDNNMLIGDELQDLSLSNNELSGTIPYSILKRQWTKLDLSSNKLNGLLTHEMPALDSNQTLLLQNNRLSGVIPLNLHLAKNINILIGNLFTCPLFNSEDYLPIYNKNVAIYKCGSNNFNVATIFGSTILLILFIYSFINIKITTNINYAKYWNEYKKHIDFLRISGEINISPPSSSFQKSNNLTLLNDGLLDNNNNNNNEILSDSYNNVNEMINLDNKIRNSNSIIRITFNGDMIDKLECSNITKLCELSDYLLYFLLIFSIFLLFIWFPVSILLSSYYKTFTVPYAWLSSSIFLSGLTPLLVLLLLMGMTIYLVYYLLESTFPKKLISENVINLISKDIIKSFKRISYKRFFGLSIVVIINVIAMLTINGVYIYITLTKNAMVITFSEITMSAIKTLWRDITLPYILSYVSSNDEIILQCWMGILNTISIPFFATIAFEPSCFYNALVPQSNVVSSYIYKICISMNADTDSCQNYEYFHRETSYTPPFVYSYQCTGAVAIDYCAIYIYMSLFLVIGRPSLRLLYNLFKVINSKILLNIYENNIKKYTFFNHRAFIVNVVCSIAIIVNVVCVIPIMGLICCIFVAIYIHNTLSNMGFHLSKSNEQQYHFLRNFYENNSENVTEYVKEGVLSLIPVMIVFYSIFLFDTIGNYYDFFIAGYIWLVIVIVPLCVYFSFSIIHKFNDINDNNSFINRNKRTMSVLELGPVKTPFE